MNIVHEKEELYNKNVMIMVYLSKEKSMNEMIQIFNDLRDRKLNMNKFKTQLKEEYDYELDDKTESEVNQMCNFSQYVKEEGKIEGKIEGKMEGKIEGIEETTIKNIINMMDSFKMTMDEVMEGMKLSDKDKEKYRLLILNQ